LGLAGAKRESLRKTETGLRRYAPQAKADGRDRTALGFRADCLLRVRPRLLQNRSKEGFIRV